MKRLLVMILCCSVLNISCQVCAETDAFDSVDLTALEQEAFELEQERWSDYHIVLVPEHTAVSFSDLYEPGKDTLLSVCRFTSSIREIGLEELSEDEQKQVNENSRVLDGVFKQRFFASKQEYEITLRVFLKEETLKDAHGPFNVGMEVAVLPGHDGVLVRLGEGPAKFDFGVQMKLSEYLRNGSYDIISADYLEMPSSLSKKTIADVEQYKRIVATECRLEDGNLWFQVKEGDPCYYMVYGYELTCVNDPFYRFK